MGLTRELMVKLGELILKGGGDWREYIGQIFGAILAYEDLDKSILLQDRILTQFLAMATLILVPAILFRDFGSSDQKRGTMLTYKFLSFGFLVLGAIFKTIGWMI